MLVSLKWLRDYVEIPNDLDVQDLAHRLTMASAEVEGIRTIGQNWDHDLIIVGKILDLAPHPNADRLRLATVDHGTGSGQQVVCGAPNIESGQCVAFGREGAHLIEPKTGEPFTLRKATIRGLESAGMVLSERELGISDEHDGIMVLPDDAPIGTPLAEYLGDVILDVHTWPNRADTMSMVGIARELAAILDLKWNPPDGSDTEITPSYDGTLQIDIDDPKICSRYVGTIIEGLEIGPSPQWMQERLKSVGQRPINNLVDITNYVMFELGQPLHAFDLDLIRSPIRVRNAIDGELLRTLDGEERALTDDTLVITDSTGPIALAGVMGGASTEVSKTTRSIMLEAAQFDGASIRRTSTRQRLRSEASARFERGLSPDLALHAIQRATKLLVDICGGSARSGVIDVYPHPRGTQTVAVSRSRLDTIIGFHVPTDEVRRTLEILGFKVEDHDDIFTVSVPWWRMDISIPDDIAEEVIRIAGYDRLPATTLSGPIPRQELNPISILGDRLRDAFSNAGLQETISYSLTTYDVLSRVIPASMLDEKNLLRISNPQSSDRELLRPTLRHSALEGVARNVRAGMVEVALFEVARVYLTNDASSSDTADNLPDEKMMLIAAISGQDVNRWGSPSNRTLDFFDAKGVLEQVFDELGVEARFVADDEFGMLPGRIARLYGVSGPDDGRNTTSECPVGILAEVHPETLAGFGIEQSVALLELDLAQLLDYIPIRHEVRETPRFPAVEQDLALVVDEDVPAGDIQSAITNSKLVTEARVFDVYHGDTLPPGKKSVAFAIRYQDTKRTLTGNEANTEQSAIVDQLRREFGAELRN